MPTGSLMAPKTIGIVPVAFFAAKPAGGRHDDIDLLAHEVFREILQAFEISFRGLALDDDIPSLHVAEFHELAREGHGKRRAQAGVEQPNFKALPRARRATPPRRP